MAEIPSLQGPDGQPVPPEQMAEAGLLERTETGAFAVPHIMTFSSLINAAWKVYSTRWDEAYRHSRENALSMERDCWLMAMMNERWMAVEQLNWHLEPENAEDPAQVEVADGLTRIIRRIRNFKWLKRSLLWAVWKGRAGCQIVLGQQVVNGRPVKMITDHRPVNGDKLHYRYRLPDSDDKTKPGGDVIEDGTPVLHVNQAEITKLGDSAKLVYTDQAAGLLLTPGWRERFLIHKHEPCDADFWEAELAGGIHGTGVRSRIYLVDWLRKEFAAWLADFLERVGLGLTVIYYEQGNASAKAAALELAKTISKNSVVVWPRPIGSEKQGSGIERIEVPLSGAEVLIKLQQLYMEQIERYIIGQTGSSRSDAEGLGTHSGDAMRDTKYRITKSDAEDLGETLTWELVESHKRWNYPGAEFPVYFKIDVDAPNAKERMAAAKSFFDMGGSIDEDEAREMAGLSKPSDGAPVLKKQDGMGQLGPDGQPMPGQPGAGAQGGGELEQQWEPYRGPRGGTYERNPMTGAKRPAHFARDEILERFDRLEGMVQYLAGNWVQEVGPRSGKPRWRNRITGNVTYKQPGEGRKPKDLEQVQGPDRAGYQQHVDDAKRGLDAQDQEALERVIEKVTTAGAQRGNLGVGGMQELARVLGVPGGKGLRKQQLAQAIVQDLQSKQGQPAAGPGQSQEGSAPVSTEVPGQAQQPAAQQPPGQPVAAPAAAPSVPGNTQGQTAPQPAALAPHPAASPPSPSATPSTPTAPAAPAAPAPAQAQQPPKPAAGPNIDPKKFLDDLDAKKRLEKQRATKPADLAGKSSKLKDLKGRVDHLVRQQDAGGISFVDRVALNMAAASPSFTGASHPDRVKLMAKAKAELMQGLSKPAAEAALAQLGNGGPTLSYDELRQALEAGGLEKWQPQDKPEWLQADQKPEDMRNDQQKRADMHAEAVKQPAQKRLAEIQQRDKQQTGRTFVSDALARLVSMASPADVGGKQAYDKLVERMVHSQGRAHISAEERGFMQTFREQNLQKLLGGHFAPEKIDQVLHELNAQGRGTVTREELVELARRAWAARRENPQAFAREAETMLRYSA